MTWVAVAIGGAALVGGIASNQAAKKQADAATHAADIAQGQAAVNRSDQQPYVQSGYGALSRLNTLMGLGGQPVNQPTAAQPPQGSPQDKPLYLPSNMQTPTDPPRSQAMSGGIPSQNPQLRQILAIRAQNGDAQANQLLKVIQ